MSRFVAKSVFFGLVTAWRLAGVPTSFCPSSVNPTIDGVVRAPSAFSITFALPPSITATQLLVVPRSMPITSPDGAPLLSGRASAGSALRSGRAARDGRKTARRAREPSMQFPTRTVRVVGSTWPA